MTNIITFPRRVMDPNNLAELVTADGEVYEFYGDEGGKTWLRYTMDAEDPVRAWVIPMPVNVLKALTGAALVRLPVRGVVR